MLCPSDNPRWDECPAVYGYMTSRSLDVRFVDGRAAVLFPQSETDTLIVLGPGVLSTGIELERYAQPLPEATVPLREAVDAYRFYRLPRGTAPIPIVQPEGTPARLENGIESGISFYFNRRSCIWINYGSQGSLQPVLEANSSG